MIIHKNFKFKYLLNNDFLEINSKFELLDILISIENDILVIDSNIFNLLFEKDFQFFFSLLEKKNNKPFFFDLNSREKNFIHSLKDQKKFNDILIKCENILQTNDFSIFKDKYSKNLETEINSKEKIVIFKDNF